MYRWLSLLTCFLGIALIGADAPAPAGPNVVVFAFVPSGTATADAGTRISAALVAKLVAGGKVAARSGPSETRQSDYLTAAQKLGGDYYVSGFVSGLGSGFTAALQLVSTRNGVPVWAGTTTLGTIDDIDGAASVLAVQVVNHDQRTFSGFGAARAPAGAGGPGGPAGPASPAARPAATSAPVAAAPPRTIGRTVAVLDTIGAQTDDFGDYISDSLSVALLKRGLVATRWHRKQPALDVGTDLLCDETKTSLIVSPSISVVVDSGANATGQWNTVTLQLASYDCAQHALLAKQTGTNSAWNWRWASERALGTVADQFAGQTAAKR